MFMNFIDIEINMIVEELEACVSSYRNRARKPLASAGG
jgi:hypothetical protein